jgi:sterol desaturase/sphingolipid hydroxylase (fatty acid hydroxylase superfamily)
MEIIHTFLNGYSSYAGYLWGEISQPGPKNYFYWLIIISAFFFMLEWFTPWRKDQAKFRKDFWLDFFYMFFNFFLFSLLIYNAASNVVVDLFNSLIQGIFNFDLQSMNPLLGKPMWMILLVGFLVRDFVQWWIHRLLHRVPYLWNFHKVHHSVEEMGFAAHLRYHWMENVVYRSIEYLPLALLGIGLYDFFIIHIFTVVVGHYNHSNVKISGKITGMIFMIFIYAIAYFEAFDIHILIGLHVFTKMIIFILSSLFGYFVLGNFMKYIFNSPEMHIWHHAEEWPKDKPHGINFGLTLSIWDYLFKTASIPYDGREIKLGFPGVEKFPKDFISQEKYGF